MSFFSSFTSLTDVADVLKNSLESSIDSVLGVEVKDDDSTTSKAGAFDAKAIIARTETTKASSKSGVARASGTEMRVGLRQVFSRKSRP